MTLWLWVMRPHRYNFLSYRSPVRLAGERYFTERILLFTWRYHHMIKAIFFDLDGTLLPMDQELFVKTYLEALGKKMAVHGYDPRLLIKSIWAGTAAMVQNEGNCTNEEIFWKETAAQYGRDIRCDQEIFLEFYKNEFQEIRNVCGFTPQAKKSIRLLIKEGYRVILATNPLFPAIATYSRIRWAGLDPADFELITTYENSTRCKPNPAYYQEILDKMDLKAEDCLMVGNDAQEDMAAQETGMQVFLLTDCLINRQMSDISLYPQGSFLELLDFIEGFSI